MASKQIKQHVEDIEHSEAEVQDLDEFDGVNPVDTDSPLGVADPSDQQVSTVVDGVIVEAAARAAAFVQERGYGKNTVELVRYIAANAVDTADLNAVILEQMAERMINATSPDAILDPFGTMKGRDQFNRPLWVTGCTFLESEYAEGFPWYASFAVADQKTGSTSVITVGGEKLVLQAAAIDLHDGWPLAIKICQADKETKAGFRPLELRPAVS